MKRRKVSTLLGRVWSISCLASAATLLVCDAANAQQYLRGDRPTGPSGPPGVPSLHFLPPILLPFPPRDSGPPPADSGTLPASSPPPTYEGLLKDGPLFPTTSSVGSFDVVGFARSGWPYVIDFEPRPDSCTWVQVDSAEAAPWRAILDEDGRAGRHIVRVALPEQVGKEPRPAHYVVYSVNKPCAVADAKRDFSPIDVYAMGAGPRAVGSMAINNLKFGPSVPRFPQEVANFTYVAENDFGRISQEILDFRENGPGRWTVVPVRTTELFASQRGPHNGIWDGTRQTGKRAPGVYRLQVRAWNTLNDEKSWVGAISQDSVHISPP